jgi:hypothetical protein
VYQFSSAENAVSPENNNPVSAQATFSLSGATLTVVLQNKTVGGTQALGDILTGVVFLGKPEGTSFTVSSTALTPGSEVYVNGTSDPSFEVDGTWGATLDEDVGDWSGGTATTGWDLFSAKTIGGDKGGPGYGIVSAGTFPGTIDGTEDKPLVQDSLTFTFSIDPEASLTIEKVGFLFGTSAGAIVDASKVHAHAPEPASLIVWGAILGGCYVVARRRTRMKLQ